MIKKLDRLDGERYRDAGYGDCEIRMELSRMVIQMIIAEDLGIPVVYDYRFCEVVCMLILYEEEVF